MARISEQEFFDDKDVITQIEILKKNVGTHVLQDVKLVQDTTIGSATYGRVTMTFLMEDGSTYERYFDNTAVKEITSKQEGTKLTISFHLSNGQTYDVECTITATATCAWTALTGDPKDSTALTNRMHDYIMPIRDEEKTARTNADTAINKRIDDMETALDKIFHDMMNIIYPVGSLYITTKEANPKTYLGFGTWSLYGEGKVLVCRNSADTDYKTVRQTGGSKTVKISTENMPSHSHTIAVSEKHAHSGWTGADGGGKTPGCIAFLGEEGGEGSAHLYKEGTWTYGGTINQRDFGRLELSTHGHPYTTDPAGDHTHTCQPSGSNVDVNVMNPYIVVMTWERTA